MWTPSRARWTGGCSGCFFFQAEDGIRDYKVTGVQTCALPISRKRGELPVEHVVESEQLRELRCPSVRVRNVVQPREESEIPAQGHPLVEGGLIGDRKSTRLNSSHLVISYAVFCLKKKNHATVVMSFRIADSHILMALAQSLSLPSSYKLRVSWTRTRVCRHRAPPRFLSARDRAVA